MRLNTVFIVSAVILWGVAAASAPIDVSVGDADRGRRILSLRYPRLFCPVTSRDRSDRLVFIIVLLYSTL